jgi:hypothetical protein
VLDDGAGAVISLTLYVVHHGSAHADVLKQGEGRAGCYTVELLHISDENHTGDLLFFCLMQQRDHLPVGDHGGLINNQYSFARVSFVVR